MKLNRRDMLIFLTGLGVGLTIGLLMNPGSAKEVGSAMALVITLPILFGLLLVLTTAFRAGKGKTANTDGPSKNQQP